MDYAQYFPYGQDPTPIAELPPDERTLADMMAGQLARAPLPEVQEAMAAAPGATLPQLIDGMRLAFRSMGEQNASMLARLQEQEQELRGRLQLIASATDGGE
jgi:hypothetical protein